MLYTLCYSTLSEQDHTIEIPYLPRIGIATLPDAGKIQNLCNELNAGSLEISGTLESATVCEYDGTKVINLEQIAFGN